MIRRAYFNHFVSHNKHFITNFRLCSKECLPDVASRNTILEGKLDRHKAIVIDSKINFCKNVDEFKSKLEVSLDKWSADCLNGVWFNIAVPQVVWIPALIEKGFKIHHAMDDMICLYLWLPENEPCKIPSFAHHMVGAGAAVINDKKQILVVRERFRSFSIWKLPGGYVDKGEDIGQAAMREVLEETGIKTEFMSLLGMRYVNQSIFGCSDMYFIVRLKPISSTIVWQEDEVEDCKWMDVDEFLSHREVVVILKKFVQQALENDKEGIVMDLISTTHPISKTPQMIFSITKKEPPIS